MKVMPHAALNNTPKRGLPSMVYLNQDVPFSKGFIKAATMVGGKRDCLKSTSKMFFNINLDLVKI